MDIVTTHYLRKYDEVNNDLLLVSYATTDLLRVFTEIVKGRQEPTKGQTKCVTSYVRVSRKRKQLHARNLKRKDGLERT